jgi:N-acetylgalactosamine-N,N'-diacetylbacillosaminyl-diphospho-undecaprenol 4-alpha-N-acetylgalactosaminyltransferase
MTGAAVRRRVAFVINSLEGGGAQRVASVLLSEFQSGLAAACGFEFHLVLLDDTPARYAVPADLPVHVVGAAGRLDRSVLGLRRILAELRVDAALSFLTRANFAVLLSGAPKRFVSERVHTSTHFAGAGRRALVSKALVRLLYPRADRVFAVSEGVAADLRAGYGVRADRLQVIYNPYDIAAIERASAAPNPFAGAAPYCVAVGRLTASKNHAMLIRAFARSGAPGNLVILGEGEERGALGRLAASLGFGDRVLFGGFHPNPYPVMAGAWAYVSASNAEGFPNAAAEAMVLGRTVALTDCPSGPGELLGGSAKPGAGLRRAPYGMLTPVGDEDALVEAVRAAADPALQAAYGLEARRRMQEFRSDRIARTYAGALVEAVAAGSPAGAPQGAGRGRPLGASLPFVPPR